MLCGMKCTPKLAEYTKLNKQSTVPRCIHSYHHVSTICDTDESKATSMTASLESELHIICTRKVQVLTHIMAVPDMRYDTSSAANGRMS